MADGFRIWWLHWEMLMVGAGLVEEASPVDMNLGLYGGDQFSCLRFLLTLLDSNGKTLMGKQG